MDPQSPIGRHTVIQSHTHTTRVVVCVIVSACVVVCVIVSPASPSPSLASSSPAFFEYNSLRWCVCVIALPYIMSHLPPHTLGCMCTWQPGLSQNIETKKETQTMISPTVCFVLSSKQVVCCQARTCNAVSHVGHDV